jgi:hypothetical protein
MSALVVHESDLAQFEQAVREGVRRIEERAADDRRRVEERAARDLSIAVEELDHAYELVAELRAQVDSLTREASRHRRGSFRRSRSRPPALARA